MLANNTTEIKFSGVEYQYRTIEKAAKCCAAKYQH